MPELTYKHALFSLVLALLAYLLNAAGLKVIAAFVFLIGWVLMGGYVMQPLFQWFKKKP